MNELILLKIVITAGLTTVYIGGMFLMWGIK